MIKVLIADVDTEIIRSFHTHIKTSFPQIKNVSTTSDTSKDITEMVRSVKPQLIIADIRFFGVGNVQKIRSLNDRFPDVRFLLYGTYNDADYIKKVMEFGVLDHMYRPIKPVEFHRCMESALNYFKEKEQRDKREAEIIQTYQNERHLFESVFLTSLINGQLKNETEIYYTFKYFGFDLKPDFTVFVVHIDHFKKIILTMDEMEKHLLTYSILLIIEKKLQGRKSKVFIGSFNVINVILSGKQDLEGLIALCDDIKQAVFKGTNTRVTLGIGRTYETPADIWVSYREAQGALRYRFHMGYNSVIHILFVEPDNHISYRFPIGKEERLIHTATIGEYEYSVTLLKEIFDAIKASQPLPDMYLSKIIMNILISINRNLGEQNIKIQSRFTSFFPSQEVLELGDDIDRAFDYLSNALKNFCEHIVQSRTANNSSLVSGVKAYVEEKYYESFSLAKVATELSTTPEYLNKLFTEQEGCSIFDYVLGVRMAEAKRMLRETKLDDDMIAVKIGYDDARHFRSVFKKHEDMSAGEYRGMFGAYGQS